MDGGSAAGAAPAADDTNRAALELLLARLYEPVRRFVLGRVQRFPDAPEVASDVAQETLIRLAAAVQSCRAESDGQVIAWALVTARRALIIMLRRPGSGLAAREVAVALEQDLGAVSFDESTGRRPEASPGFEVLLRLAVEAYAETPPATADLLWRRLVAGAEWEEVGLEFGTTAAGAKRRFQRATARLRRMIERRLAELDEAERGVVDRVLARLFRRNPSQGHTGRGAA